MRKANLTDRNFFNKNGYIVFKSVLTTRECDMYIKAAHRAVSKITVTPNLYRKSKKILELLRNPKILNLADTYYCINTHLLVQFNYLIKYKIKLTNGI